MTGYSGTPLPKKLGIKEDMTIGIFGAPDDFDATLGELPTGNTFHDREQPSDTFIGADWPTRFDV